MFIINVSRESYKNKKDALACLTAAGAKSIGRCKMAFKEQQITIDEFLSLAEQGHSFCNLFEYEENKKYYFTGKDGAIFARYPIYRRGPNKGCMKLEFKRDAFFKASQAIFVDIDYTTYSDVGDYIDCLTIKPSCAYMSYSDGLEKNGIMSRRFHLVYVFSTLLDYDCFTIASHIINTRIVEDTHELLDDDCGKRRSQYFNGCYGNEETYNTSIVHDYSKLIAIFKQDKQQEEGTSYYICENETTPCDIDKEVVHDMQIQDYDTFMRYNRHKFKYFYRPERDDWVNGTYQYIDDNYFCLPYTVEGYKICDGQGRRKSLYARMCLRRIMKPDVNPTELLFNAYEDLHRFYDNSDGTITIDCLVKNVESCFNNCIEQLEEKYAGTIQELKAKRPKSGIIIKPGVSKNIGETQALIREINYKRISTIYNPALSVKENWEVINSQFPIHISSLYKYCDARGIKFKLNDDDIMEIIDFNKSANSNYKNIKNKGIKISKKRLLRIYNKNR